MIFLGLVGYQIEESSHEKYEISENSFEAIEGTLFNDNLVLGEGSNIYTSPEFGFQIEMPNTWVTYPEKWTGPSFNLTLSNYKNAQIYVEVLDEPVVERSQEQLDADFLTLADETDLDGEEVEDEFTSYAGEYALHRSYNKVIDFDGEQSNTLYTHYYLVHNNTLYIIWGGIVENASESEHAEFEQILQSFTWTD